MKETILIVDDSADNRAFCGLIAKMHNLKVKNAKSVDDALEKIGRGLKPDFVLLDLMMPGRRPEELVNHIKNNPALKDTQIMVLSALREVKTIATNLGANYAMKKPLNLSQFSLLITQLQGQTAS